MHPEDDLIMKPTEAAPSEPEVDRRESLFDEVFERATAAKGTNGGSPQASPLPRRFVTFTMDHTLCSPGVFPANFELTLRSLTSAEEYATVRGITDATLYQSKLAKATICQMNGRQLKAHEVEWLWEAIGGGGRQIVQIISQQVGMADDAILKKTMESLRIH